MSKRDDLINAGLKLFSKNGFHATGIEKILTEANSSKMTLYNYFSSKDELIIAVLDLVHEKFMNDVLKKIEEKDISPKDKILELVETLVKSAKMAKEVRCIFINASAEFPDLNHPAHEAAHSHKLTSEKFVLKQLKTMQHPNAIYLSRIITTLLQGALVMSQIGGDKKYYEDASSMINKIC